jgi:glutathione peroxidase
MFLMLSSFSMALGDVGGQAGSKAASDSTSQTAPIYGFQQKLITGESVDFSQYKGKVLLVVNTASKCGFTSQYKGLEELWRTYKDKGLVVLGFPCNQFGGQEPGTDTEISQFCEKKFEVSFPMFSKIDVNGDNADPLYKYLKTQAPGLLSTEAIKWNFTKFLVDRNGKVLERFASSTKPESLVQKIEKLLAQE